MEMDNFRGCLAHLNASSVNAVVLYIVKKINNSDSNTAGGWLQCSKLVGVTLCCPFHREKKLPFAMWLSVKILRLLV